jgi:tRNA A37 methylthiotransferase MiaB
MKKSVLVATNGCPENRLDCAEIEQVIVRSGLKITNRIDQADLVILNLCGLLDENEKKSLNLIRSVNKKKSAAAKVIVTGCLPKINRNSITTSFDVDIIEGHNLTKILNALKPESVSADTPANYLSPVNLISEGMFARFRRKMTSKIDLFTILERLVFATYRKHWERLDIVQPDTFYIKVCSGCVYRCSYCAVKFSRGYVRSKPINKIKNEFLNGIEAGYKEFALIGTDLGSYGKDIQTDLLCLIEELLSIDEDFKVRLRNVHPKLLINNIPKLLPLVKTKKISHITTAIQHGNDRILRLMKRGYAIKDCISAINAIKKENPEIVIRSQLIVGFPGETHSDFNDTLNILNSANVDFFEIYPFSPRISTLASKLPNQISRTIINQRRYTAIKKYLKKNNLNTECQEDIKLSHGYSNLVRS